MKLPKTYEEVMNPYDMWAEPKIKTSRLNVWNALARAADGWFYIIIPDEMAGRKNRYTTYRMSVRPGRMPRAHTIGLELPLDDSYKQINKWIKEFTCEA